MNKLIPLLISGVLVVGIRVVKVVLKDSSTDAPNAANESAQAPDAGTAQQTQNDAQRNS